MQKLLKTASCSEAILWLFKIQFALILINIPLFGDSYIFSVFAAILFSFIPFNLLLITKRETIISIGGKIDYTACYLLFGLSIYYILGTVVRTQQFSLLHLYYLSLPCFLGFMQYALNNRYKRGFLKQAFYWFFFLAFLESLLCFLQYGALVAVQSNYFNVTGTTQNPNVTAMFLAMSFPAVLAVYSASFKGIYKVFYVIAIAIILTALIMLKCRTAFAGVVFATLLFLIVQNKNTLSQKVNKTLKAILIILLTLSTILLAYGLYMSKKESAEGRMFIWKTATQYILKNPVTGSGLGMLEKDYNMEQALYFKKHGITDPDASNAGFIQFLYNEYLSSLFEGGLIGFGLFIVFLLVVLKNLVKLFQKYSGDSIVINKHHLAACIGVLVFLFMSMVNFTIIAVPVMFVFLFYVAVIINKATEDKTVPAYSQQYNLVFNRTVSIIAVICLLFSIKQASLFYQVGKMVKYNSEKDYQSAFNIGSRLKETPPWTSRFWAECGYAAYYLGKYKISAQCFSKAVANNANPEYYMLLSDAHLKYKSLKNAITGYEIAANIQPHKLRPRYSLIQLSLYKNDTVAAIKYAHEIIQITPKVENSKAAFYKKEAQLFLDKTSKNN